MTHERQDITCCYTTPVERHNQCLLQLLAPEVMTISLVYNLPLLYCRIVDITMYVDLIAASPFNNAYGTVQPDCQSQVN